MKRTFQMVFLLILLASCNHTNPMQSTVKRYAYQAYPFVITAVSIVALLAMARIAMHTLLPTALENTKEISIVVAKEVAQVGKDVGIVAVHQVAQLGEKTVKTTAPFAAGGFLIHHLMNTCGINTQQAISRIGAGAATLFLLKIQLSQAIGL